MEIAAQHAESERVAAGIDVEERLLLHRIAGQAAGDIAKRHAQPAGPVETHLADATPAFGNETAMAAGQTTNTAALGPPKFALSGAAIQRLRQRFAGEPGLGWLEQRAHDHEKDADGKIALAVAALATRHCGAAGGNCQSRHGDERHVLAVL